MYRERLTITMEAELVAAADTLVDKSTIRNRSHAIEHLVREALGLHLLAQAFLFVEQDGWTQEMAVEAIRLCKDQGISQLFLCLPASAAGLRSDMEQIINSAGDFSIVSVPSDFGTGASIALQRPLLQNSFLLLWIGKGLMLPRSLTAPYVFHRQGRRPVTQLIASDNGKEYSSCRICLAEPELLAHIPAGQSSLEDEVFPELLKAGSISAYVINGSHHNS